MTISNALDPIPAAALVIASAVLRPPARAVALTAPVTFPLVPLSDAVTYRPQVAALLIAVMMLASVAWAPEPPSRSPVTVKSVGDAMVPEPETAHAGFAGVPSTVRT